MSLAAAVAAVRALQCVNRLQNHRELCRKDGLAANLQRIRTALRAESLPWVPETYILPGRGDKAAYQE